MIAAGVLAKKALARGLTTKPWVKTSLAPGSRVVTKYLDNAGLSEALDALRFQTVGYGCTTCIGNSGPLPSHISQAIDTGKLVVCSVLSGNRNFEGRVQQEVRANYLMSPPLVVAYALAGRIDLDFHTEALGQDANGESVYLRDIWPTQAEVAEVIEQSINAEMYKSNYADVFAGDANWNAIPAPSGALFAWDEASSYIKNPPYFDNMSAEPPATVSDIVGAKVLAVLGDSITTDHISPAGGIKANSPAGKFLAARGISPAGFNSYGSRRGHDEVMVRGTFANVRIRNLMAPGTEGGVTTYLPTGEVMSIYDAAMGYKASNTPTVILAGKEYGSGSSRDWAAKGPYLQGVKAVIAESYERIHRSNLVGMGILPLQFQAGENVVSLGLTGQETLNIPGLSEGIATGFANGHVLTITATAPGGTVKTFDALVRIDTPQEVQYYRHGGILQYVLRQLLKS
jgi:aconitate hydratase